MTVAADPSIPRGVRMHAADGMDSAALAASKAGTRISVVIPARDEAGTIGPIVESIRAAHLETSGLIDELVVIDSDSTDATARIAREAGATVHAAADIRPELGRHAGKGEAMWKSLFVTHGELIAFIDGDLTAFTPDYVTGLVAPLLLDPHVALVKGFYDRDLDGGTLERAQGGRVTELLARPLLNQWWPELADIIQPLAGEWSARRAILESLSIPCGYGVEIAVLVDVYASLGLDAIAQVDLGRRQHFHQDLASLGVLAAEVLAAATSRRFKTEQAEPVLLQPMRDAIGEPPHLQPRALNIAERPPQAMLAAADCGRSTAS